MEVLFFQVIIFIIIAISSAFSKLTHKSVTGLLFLFTLLMVFTSKLMVLQFFTIGISYLITRKSEKKIKKQSNIKDFNYDTNRPVNKTIKPNRKIAKPLEKENLEYKKQYDDIIKDLVKNLEEEDDSQFSFLKYLTSQKVSKEFYSKLIDNYSNREELVNNKIIELEKEEFFQSKDQLIWTIDRYKIFKNILILNITYLSKQNIREPNHYNYENFLNKVAYDFKSKTHSYNTETDFISNRSS